MRQLGTSGCKMVEHRYTVENYCTREIHNQMQTMAQDFYATLEVGRSASADEIQKAYRKLARKYHPDLNPDDKVAQQKFKEIQHAHDVLSDPDKRKKYDQFGADFERMGDHPFRGGGSGGGPGGFSFEEVFGGGGGPGGFQFDGDVNDLFRQFGGGGQGAGRQARGQGRARTPQPGSDLSAELTIPFNTAILGGNASIALQRDGKPESLQVKIPAGIESGKKMRLRGQGEPSRSGGPSGDLLVTVNVAAHPFFKRIGKNLELKLPVTMGEAALGSTADIPTPGGTVTLKIPSGSSGGRRLRIKGQGVGSGTDNAGDLFVELQIKTPEPFDTPDSLPDDVKQAIEKIDGLYASPVRGNIVW